MVNISSYWNYDLKREVFKVRGEIGYTKSTDISLIEGTYRSETVEYGILPVTVDVVGNIGDSTVVFYDNDDLIPVLVNNEEVEMLEWTEDTAITDVEIKIPYQEEHNIVAKYLPNNQCRGSQSRVINITKPVPTELEATISRYNDTKTVYNPANTISLPIQLNCNHSLSESTVKTVYVYLNDVLKDTLELSFSQGTSIQHDTATVTDVVIGKNTVTCVFEGDNENFPSRFAFDISVGYQAEFTVPNTIVNDSDVVINAKITDYLDNPIEGIFIDIVNSSQQIIIDDESDGTDANGESTITITNADFSSDIGFGTVFGFRTGNSSIYHQYFMDQVVNQDIVALELSVDRPVISKDISTTITAEVTGTSQSLPVTFSMMGTSETVRTNSDGLAIYQYTGDGTGGLMEVTAAIQGYTDSMTIEDVAHYWLAPNIQWDTTKVWANMTALNNGFRILSQSGYSGFEIDNICDSSGRNICTWFNIVATTSGYLSLPNDYPSQQYKTLPIRNGDKIMVVSYKIPSEQYYRHYFYVVGRTVELLVRTNTPHLRVFMEKANNYIVINELKVREYHRSD